MKEREKINILLVDDKRENLVSLEAPLENPDHNIIKATSGNEALSLMLEHDFALVLLDVHMPEMDGFELAELMRGSEKTKYIPIIFVTAISKEQKHVFKGYESGAVDYLFKPLDSDILKSKANVFLELHRQKKLLAKVNKELQQEINERKETEEALRESEMINRSLLEGSPVCNKIITTDFKLQYMSSAGIKTLKISDINTCYGHEYPPKFFCEESRIAIIKKLKIALAGEISEVECITHTTEGDELWYLHTFVPVIDVDGRVKHIIGSSVNVTDRKRSEEKVTLAAEEWSTTFNSMTSLVSIQDKDCKIVRVNKAYADTLKLKPEGIIGKPCYEVIHGTKEPWPDCPHKKTLDNKKPFTEDFMEPRLGIHIEVSTSPIFNDKDEIVGTVHIATDITKRKEMEKKLLQSEKLKSLGELAGGVAHDFNNVLAAILGNAQLLKMSLTPPEGVEEKRKAVHELKHGLTIIEKAAKDGAETIRRIQEFARKRDDDKYFTAVNINEIIDNSLDFTKVKWKDNAESKGIKITIKKEFSTLPATSGSAAELREVLTNLINNAADAMPQGGDIKVKTFKEDSQIVIEVADTGNGIPSELRDRIFDPFLTTKGVQSTGLGLSVSYGIITRHRGTISVDSSEGEGTTFTIKLPITERIDEEEKLKPIQVEQRKAKILVIEDEEHVRNLLSAILTKGGHEVETAPDGMQGMEIFEKKEFELVFTDLGMPDMSGWQVAEKIKSINERIPVALITGWNIELKQSETKESGVDLVIQKPFDIEQVLNLVQEGMLLRDRFKAN